MRLIVSPLLVSIYENDEANIRKFSDFNVFSGFAFGCKLLLCIYLCKYFFGSCKTNIRGFKSHRRLFFFFPSIRQNPVFSPKTAIFANFYSYKKLPFDSLIWGKHDRKFKLLCVFLCVYVKRLYFLCFADCVLIANVASCLYCVNNFFCFAFH